MSTRPQELNKIIADLRQIIVGKVAMPTDQIEQITLFLFLKQLSKKHDELVRIGSKELIFTGAWERYHFDVLVRHSGEDLVKECREAVESLYKNPHIDPTVRKVFERSYLKILDPKVLSSFLIYLNDKFSDGLDLGDFYESLLPILGTQNELGQFRTPRHIIDFIIRVVDPSIGEKIADPACGTAGFLVSAFNYLKEKYTEKGRLTLSPEQTKQLYNDTIYGWDMEPLMVKFSLANLYLHGLKVPNVSENDTLLNENLWQHTFDIIVANPPFITPKGGARRHSRFAITSNKTEVLFSEWMVHHLNFNGRMGIIVPEGIIFDSSKGHQAIRKLFLDNGLWCVVSLPAGVFQPYAGVKTSIIFLDKTLKPENILFYKIDNHGFSLNTNPTPIDKNDLPEALKVINNYKNQLQDNKQEAISNEKYTTVPKIKIVENSTKSLNGGIYQESKVSGKAHWQMVKLGEVCSLEYGKPLKEEDRGGGDYPVYGSNGIVGLHNEYLVKGPFIIIGRKGTAGAVVYSEKSGYPIDTAFYVKIKSGIELNLKYLYFTLRQLGLGGLNNQAGVPGLNRNDAYQQIIPLPPLDVQEQIVAELEGYQKVIDGAKQVVDSWLPSFEIDPKCEVKKLGELFDMQNGRGFGREEWTTKGIPIIRIANLNSDQAEYNYFNGAYDKKIEVQNEDLLFSWSGTIGTSFGPHYWQRGKGLLNQHIYKFIPKRDDIDKRFAYYYLLKLVPAIESKAHGAGGLVHITKAELSQFQIHLPSIETQKMIVDEIEEEQKIIGANRRMIELFQKKIEAKVKSIWSE